MGQEGARLQWLSQEVSNLSQSSDEEIFLSINQMQILLQEEQAIIQYKLNKIKENNSSMVNRQSRENQNKEESKQGSERNEVIQAKQQSPSRTNMNASASPDVIAPKSSFGNYSIQRVGNQNPN